MTDFHGVIFGKLRTCLSQHALAPIMTRPDLLRWKYHEQWRRYFSLSLFFLSLEQNSPMRKCGDHKGIYLKTAKQLHSFYYVF